MTKNDINFVLAEVLLSPPLAARLRATQDVDQLTDDEFIELNDACIAELQHRGFGVGGRISLVGRRLEAIVDALNEE